MVDKNPMTEKSLGISLSIKNDGEKFSTIRSKAKQEWVDRHIKAKRNRRDPIPEYKIDQEIVIVKGRFFSGNQGTYILMKVIDFEEKDNKFIYYGIVLKVTDKKLLGRVGRLISTNTYFYDFYPANVGYEKIKWVEEK